MLLAKGVANNKFRSGEDKLKNDERAERANLFCNAKSHVQMTPPGIIFSNYQLSTVVILLMFYLSFVVVANKNK